MAEDKRRFIRHPTEMPIEVVNGGGGPGASAPIAVCGTNIGQGGIAFRHARRLPPGAVIGLRIACVTPVFESPARVVWCRDAVAGFELGVEFLDADAAFRARMVEQVCHIETYRATVRAAEGRELSAGEAALEWIARHAADFPSLHEDGRV